MHVSIEEIEDPTKFEKILELPYSRMAEFVMARLKNKSMPMILFWISCIITLALSVIYFFVILPGNGATIIFFHILLGFVLLPIAMIPVHETLHIVPLLFYGANNIRVGADLRQFMFYVTAHRHVISKREFIPVALFPFIVISVLLLILIIILPGIWKFTMASLLFVHTSVCVGDFGLLDFYRAQGDKEIYTWDDVDNKMAYFYTSVL